MTVEYLNFLWFLLFGIGIGVFYSLLSGIVFIFKKNIVVQIISDLFFCASFGLGFLYLINKINSGEIRWFLVLGTLFGIFLHLKTLGKLFAKAGTLLYNHFVKLIDKFKSTKVGKVLYK